MIFGLCGKGSECLIEFSSGLVSSVFVRMFSRCGDGGSWRSSRKLIGSWMIVSAWCSCLVTALCRVSLVWVSVPLLQLNLPYHCSSGAELSCLAAALSPSAWRELCLVQRSWHSSIIPGRTASLNVLHMKPGCVWLRNTPGMLPTTCPDSVIGSSQSCFRNVQAWLSCGRSSDSYSLTKHCSWSTSSHLPLNVAALPPFFSADCREIKTGSAYRGKSVMCNI